MWEGLGTANNLVLNPNLQAQAQGCRKVSKLAPPVHAPIRLLHHRGQARVIGPTSIFPAAPKYLDWQIEEGRGDSILGWVLC